jgi:excisionase family DNA binding protein
MDHPVIVESFTVTEAAEALGRSVSTIRRWISDDKVPAPRLRDTVKQYPVYSVGELEVIARSIVEHEVNFVYVGSDYSHIVERLHQAIHAYREQFI